MDSRVGKLLIAHPNLPKTTPFHKTVVYIFNEDEQGVQGLILNKPTGYKVNDFIMTQGFEMPLTKEKMRFGGPVSTKLVFMLHTDDFESASSMPVGKGLMLSCDDFMLEKLSMGYQPSLWRMAVGVCMWQPGQLDMELQGHPPYRPENSWLTADANDSILFEYDGEKQWEKALELSSRQMIDSYF
jgi:putative transcriptional regulator